MRGEERWFGFFPFRWFVNRREWSLRGERERFGMGWFPEARPPAADVCCVLGAKFGVWLDREAPGAPRHGGQTGSRRL